MCNMTVIRVNPLPTNDAPIRHDLCELSISLWEFIYGGLILGAILQYMVSASFSCFLWSVKELIQQGKHGASL